jgi:transcriptional regulator with XRE-family HTH domain
VTKGLSLDEVSFVSSLDKATVSRIERCLVKPRRTTVRRLAKGLETNHRRVWELWEADWADKVLAEHDAKEPVA